MSFKPQRAILDELQRVLQANGLQFTVLPPSGATAAAAASPTSPLGKHGFVPANLAGGVVGASTSATLAPISISSLRPLPRGIDGDAASASASSAPSSSASASNNNQVLEVRAGSNRFQFHVAPIASGSAGLAKALAADFDGDSTSSSSSSAGAGSHGAGYAIRVKRVLGDAQSFREICAKLLPQLKL